MLFTASGPAAQAGLPDASSACSEPVLEPQQSGGLRVLTWNCFRLNPTRLLDLEILLQKYSPDVAIITEVDRQEGDVSQMTFPGYVCTAPPVSDGVKVRAITLCRDTIRQKPGSMKTDLPVATVLLPDFKLSIVGIYRQQHGGSITPQQEDMDSLGNILSKLPHSYDMCLAGDINLDAQQFASLPSDLYTSWIDLTTMYGLDLLETTPTYKSFGKHNGRHYISTLDQIYVSNTIPAGADAMPDAATDHFPVIGRLRVSTGASKPSKKTLEVVSRRNLALIDQEKFKKDLEKLEVQNWPPPPPETTVDELLNDFYSVINPLVNHHAPEKTFKVRRDTVDLYLSKETREAMKARDKARQGHGGDYKMLRNKCVKLVRRDRMQTALKKMSESSNRLETVQISSGSRQRRQASLLGGCRSDVEHLSATSSLSTRLTSWCRVSRHLWRPRRPWQKPENL